VDELCDVSRVKREGLMKHVLVYGTGHNITIDSSSLTVLSRITAIDNMLVVTSRIIKIICSGAAKK
jgi:hypothetical protein